MQTTDLAPASTQQVTSSTPEKPTDLRRSSSFSRKQVAIILLISVAILIPCFWLPKIEAGDLPSHTYNAWLASLVQKGQAPGLWIAPQHNNVLADILLLKTGTVLGFAATEKIVAALAVLLFFWGAFALATISSGKLPGFLAPLIAMLAYGWTFHMGFLNFYFSLGISFVGLAILGQPNRRLYRPSPRAAHEASSKQFRLRATPKNRFAETAPLNAAHMMIGDYVVQNDDLPLWQIFQCGPAETDLCLRPIHAGPLTNFTPSEAVRARPLR